MKKHLLFIAIAGLFTSMASAADLYVRDFGAGGAYSTISAAITASVDGDRIIIRPKAGGVPYIENLTIDKSLTFVCETNFSKYLIQGTISVTPSAGRIVGITNLNLTSTVTVSGATIGGRTTLNITNSVINGIIYADPSNTTFNMSGCSALAGMAFSHGRITGNTVDSIALQDASLDTNPAADDTEIIANSVTNVGYGLTVSQKNNNFKVLNNYIRGVVVILAIKTGSTNEITNNVINASQSSSYASVRVTVAAGNTGLITVTNNIIVGYSTAYDEITNNAVASVYAFYNMSNSAFSTVGVTSASNNLNSSGFTMNNTTNSVTGSNVNAGYPEDDYADIDLSRNDIGNGGGSNAWSNFWPVSVGNKPQVNYLSTPRRIYTGTTEMNAVGAGNSK